MFMCFQSVQRYTRHFACFAKQHVTPKVRNTWQYVLLDFPNASTVFLLTSDSIQPKGKAKYQGGSREPVNEKTIHHLTKNAKRLRYLLNSLLVSTTIIITMCGSGGGSSFRLIKLLLTFLFRIHYHHSQWTLGIRNNKSREVCVHIYNVVCFFSCFHAYITIKQNSIGRTSLFKRGGKNAKRKKDNNNQSNGQTSY